MQDNVQHTSTTLYFAENNAVDRHINKSNFYISPCPTNQLSTLGLALFSLQRWCFTNLSSSKIQAMPQILPENTTISVEVWRRHNAVGGYCASLEANFQYLENGKRFPRGVMTDEKRKNGNGNARRLAQLWTQMSQCLLLEKTTRSQKIPLNAAECSRSWATTTSFFSDLSCGASEIPGHWQHKIEKT